MDNRYRFVVGLLTLLNALLIVMLCGLVRDTRKDVHGLKEVLATKQELMNVAAPKLTLFHEQACTSCHTERRFAGPHNVTGEIEQAVAHMTAMQDTKFSEADVAKIHSSLTLLRCTQCHGIEKMRLLAIKSPEERMQVIQEMIAKPGSNIRRRDADEILRAYEQMLGF